MPFGHLALCRHHALEAEIHHRATYQAINRLTGFTGLKGLKIYQILVFGLGISSRNPETKNKSPGPFKTFLVRAIRQDQDHEADQRP
jgi:hypothetical protein